MQEPSILTVAPSGMENAQIFDEIPIFRKELILNGMDALEDQRLKLVSMVGACFFRSTTGFSLPIRNTSRQ